MTIQTRLRETDSGQSGGGGGGGGGTPANPDKAIQYNNSGAFGADADFYRDITDATNRYGLNIGSVSGATNNYAIYTGVGKVRFGDSIDIIANAGSDTSIFDGVMEMAGSSYPQSPFIQLGSGTSGISLAFDGGAGASNNGGPITLQANNGGSGNTDGGNIILTAGNKSSGGAQGTIQLLNGNVGIGTTTPISNNNALTTVLDISGSGLTGIAIHDTSTTQEQSIATDGAGMYFDVAGHATATNNQFHFRIGQTNSSYTLTEVMTILTNGNLNLLGLINNYNNIATVKNGVPSEIATIDSTGLTGNVGASTLYSVPSTGEGMYRVSVYLVTTTAGSISSTMPNAQIIYTDKDSNTSVTLDVSPILGAAGLGQSGLLTANTVGTVFSGVVSFYVKASTTIQYQTVNYLSSLAGMAYALRIRLEAI